MSLKVLFAPDTYMEVVTPIGDGPPAGLQPDQTITVQFRVASIERVPIAPGRGFCVARIVPVGAVIDANDEPIWIGVKWWAQESGADQTG